MATPQEYIDYYLRCFQKDKAPFQLLNFFGSRTNNTLQLNGNRLPDRSINETNILGWAKRSYKYLSIYRKEKDLILGSLFLFGKTQKLSRTQNVCAPLFYSRVELEKHSWTTGYSLTRLDPYYQVNTGFFTSFANCSPEKIDEIIQPLLGIEEITDDVIKEVKAILRKLDLPIDFSKLHHPPKVVDLRKKSYPNKKLQLLNKSALASVAKSYNTRGVIIELNDLKKSRRVSSPLKSLFKDRLDSQAITQPKFHFVPANLSSLQTNILDGIDAYETNIVIGPPGTGKSFTIAAIATDAITKGRSVLITSKNDEAVDVILDKLRLDFGLPELPIRAGRSDYKSQIKAKIKDIIESEIKNEAEHTVAQLKANVLKTTKSVSVRSARLYDNLISESKRCELSLDKEKSLIDRIHHTFLNLRLGKRPNYQNALNELVSDKTNLEILISKFIEQHLTEKRTNLDSNGAESLQKLSSAFSARTALSKEERFKSINWKDIYEFFPIWLVSAYDLQSSLPKDLIFDVVIIDEASQLDIASAIPIINRAKKVVIVGDPKQLRHVSFLSKEMEDDIAYNLFGKDINQHPASFRTTSILDLYISKLNNKDQIHVLDEHYRSYPSIINFSNTNFYNEELRLMRHALNTNATGLALKITNGHRDPKGVNNIEISEIIKRCKEFISWDKNSFAYLSIGILSPFTKQVERIQKAIVKELSFKEIERHRIIAGTPFAFQGDERDVMLLSLTIDEHTKASVLQYMSKTGVLNVSITRARTIQEIYVSVDPAKLDSKYLITQYLQSIPTSTNDTLKELSNTEKDEFLKDVQFTLGHRDQEIKIYVGQIVGGRVIDMLLKKDESRLAIDLIGYPGDFQDAYSMDIIRMLHRIDIQTYLISHTEWVNDRDRVCREVMMYFGHEPLT